MLSKIIKSYKQNIVNWIIIRKI